MQRMHLMKNHCIYADYATFQNLNASVLNGVLAEKLIAMFIIAFSTFVHF